MTEPKPTVEHFKVEGGQVVPGERNDSREWYDWGRDTGPRPRVAGFYEGADYDAKLRERHNAPPALTDRGAEREAHEASEKALREGDTKALGKIYEDLLDEIHSDNLGERAPDVTLGHAWGELEAALAAELRELSRADKSVVWGFRLTDDGLAVRCQSKTTDALECRVDKKELKRRLVHATSDARESAALIVQNVRTEIANARVLMIAGGPGAVPLEHDAC